MKRQAYRPERGDVFFQRINGADKHGPVRRFTVLWHSGVTTHVLAEPPIRGKSELDVNIGFVRACVCGVWGDKSAKARL